MKIKLDEIFYCGKFPKLRCMYIVTLGIYLHTLHVSVQVSSATISLLSNIHKWFNPLFFLLRTAECLMAVIPEISEFKEFIHGNDDAIRVPLFLVRIDGIIYNTGW